MVTSQARPTAGALFFTPLDRPTLTLITKILQPRPVYDNPLDPALQSIASSIAQYNLNG